MRDLEKHPLRIGVLGCGSFLLRRILPIVKDLQTVQIVCVQNRSREKAQKIAAQYAIPYAVATREELLAHPAVEAVHIASPNFMHEEDAFACAEAGKPTLCEKPLSTSLDSVQRIITTFRQRGVALFVGHQMRFKPAIQKARQMLQEGEFGRLLHLRAYYYSHTIPTGNWRLEKGNGGGALQEIGTHLIDLIHFITGEKICKIHAFPLQSELPEQTISVQGQLEGGALVSFECSFERPYYSGFEVIGTKSRLVSCESLRQTMDPVESLCHVRETGEQVYLPLKAGDVYVKEFQHFAEAVANNAPSILLPEISVESQKVIDFAYRLINSQNFTTNLAENICVPF